MTARSWLGFWHSLRQRLLQSLPYRTLVYEHASSQELGHAIFERNHSELHYAQVSSMAEIPATAWARMGDRERKRLSKNFASLFNKGAILHIFLTNDEIAAFIWSIPGSLLPTWYLPLRPDDIVLFAAGTRQRFRGQRLFAALMRRVIGSSLASGVKIFIDTAEWNHVAQRNIEAAGFRQILVSHAVVGSQ